MGKIRGTHSSPGIYTQMTDLSYAARTIGITTLGLVGETEKGPAFEPIEITKWDEFVDNFGNTNAEKFKDSQYPKYELPYIAQSYLKASDQLYVCRVLGLSGYNAGPAFVIAAKDAIEDKQHVIAVLRSRGTYKKYANVGLDPCHPVTDYDTLVFDCDNVIIEPYTDLSTQIYCDDRSSSTSAKTEIAVNTLDYGHFTIVCYKGEVKPENEVGRYPVSLNAGARDYIYNVLGGTPTDGDAKVFVEELYDTMLESYILSGKVDAISTDVTKFNELQVTAVAEPVANFVSVPSDSLKRKYLGQTYVYAKEYLEETVLERAFEYHQINENGGIVEEPSDMVEGGVYKVKAWIKSDGTKEYVYVPVYAAAASGETEESVVGKIETVTDEAGRTFDKVNAVYNLAYDAFVALNEEEKIMFLGDMGDYREGFRCASTPWIVSELKGDGKRIEVKKLFRFYTITDGNYANQQVKISIANIRPDDGLFDVYVRDFNDSDANPTFLETYKNLTMVPGDNRYIGLKIGTLDGSYELKSKYVMVEVIENEMTKQCVPCGFLGYPIRDYSEKGLESPTFEYNLLYDEDINERRQYFGLSDIKGVDVDVLNYKGKNAYTENYTVGYTRPFHLDSTLSQDILESLTDGAEPYKVTIDGEETDLIWDAVSPNNLTEEMNSPVIGSEDEMEGTIYENVKLRKFTVYPYGGFDGWDIYRKSRTNTDEFKANKYKGMISNGYGATFSKINNPEGLALSGNCITSDYYAYLAGINQFENPERYEINLFATPGIDYVNNALLSEDAVEMIENRLDCFYVMTTPDKPWGASDVVNDMYSSSDVASNLEDSNIDTYYASTYYPWVKYFDKSNNVYINLPATKDVLRNMADVDNKRYPWIAPAGMERGNVDCTKMHFYAKLEDRDNVYDARINALTSFSKDGVKIWGNKTMYICDETNPMNRINTVRLMLYMRKLISESVRGLIFEPNDTTLKLEFESIVKPILQQIKADRGITDFRLDVSQTLEQMDMHELSCRLWVKPTPALEAIEIEFMVTPQGIEFA